MTCLHPQATVAHNHRAHDRPSLSRHPLGWGLLKGSIRLELARPLNSFDGGNEATGTSISRKPHRWQSRLKNVGIVGKALWYLRDKMNSQAIKELTLFAKGTDLRGPHYLFYMTGLLRAAGEPGEDVPDIFATKGNRSIYIEATTKRPTRPVTTPVQLRAKIREIFDDKIPKFRDARYWPGMIVGDPRRTRRGGSERARVLVESGRYPPSFKL
jgi:hypothetical protein